MKISEKKVYTFGGNQAEGNAEMKALLGGKGANLAEMATLGIPVPAGFTLTTEVCTYYYKHNKNYPKILQGQIEEGIRNIEKIMGVKFGDASGFPLDDAAVPRPPDMTESGLGDEVDSTLAVHGADLDRCPCRVWQRPGGRGFGRGDGHPAGGRLVDPRAASTAGCLAVQDRQDGRRGLGGLGR